MCVTVDVCWLYLELTLSYVQLAEETVHDVAGEQEHVRVAVLIQANLK